MYWQIQHVLAYYDICAGGFEVHDLTNSATLSDEELCNCFVLCASCASKVAGVIGRGFSRARQAAAPTPARTRLFWYFITDLAFEYMLLKSARRVQAGYGRASCCKV